MRFFDSRRAEISGVRQSTASRVMTTGFAVFLTASARAMVVAEFLETSPERRTRSAEVAAVFNSGDLSKDPLGVLLVKEISGVGGSCFWSASGRDKRIVLIGRVLRYSTRRISVAKA